MNVPTDTGVRPGPPTESCCAAMNHVPHPENRGSAAPGVKCPECGKTFSAPSKA